MSNVRNLSAMMLWVVPGWQDQASCLERTLWVPPECRVRLGPGLPHGSLSHIRPDPHTPLELVIKAIKLMKRGKAAGTSLIVDEMLKASGVEGTRQIRDLIEDIIHFGKIPTEWEESIIVSLYNGRGLALERGNYLDLNLLDQVMTVRERVAENFIRQQVRIDDMQFRFMLGRSILDAIFIVHQLQEKFYAVNETLYMAFVDLEKACIRVIWCALCKLGIDEWLVQLIQGYMKTPDCVMLATWVKSSLWKWAFTKALAWAPYCSSQFWKSSPRSFVQGVAGKTCM